MRAISPEAKVGIFVVLTVLAIAYLSIRINKTGLSFDNTRKIYVNFENASGLLARTPVEYAGIRVGTVRRIDLVNNKARVEVDLDSKVPVYQDSIVALHNRGILGEKILTISGGGNAPEVPDGGSLDAKDSGQDFDKAIQNFNDVAKAVKDLIVGGDGKPSLRDIVSNVNDISEDLRTVIRSNRREMSDIVKNVNEFTGMLNNGDLKRIVSNLRETSETVKRFVAEANPDLKDVIQDFKATMDKVDNTVASLNRIVAKVERGEGTVGKLLSDETTINKVNTTLDGVNEFVGRLKRLEIAVGFRGEYLSTARETQTVASFRFQPSYDKYFLFEFTNGPLEFSKESTTVTNTTTSPGTSVTTTEMVKKNKFMFTALFAKRFYDLVLKAGLIRSSGGFGAEYYLFKDHLSFGFDAFDFSRDQNLHFRAYAAAHLFKILHLNGGVDDVFHEFKRRNYFGGIGIMLTDNDLKSLVGLAPLVQ